MNARALGRDGHRRDLGGLRLADQVPARLRHVPQGPLRHRARLAGSRSATRNSPSTTSRRPSPPPRRSSPAPSCRPSWRPPADDPRRPRHRTAAAALRQRRRRPRLERPGDGAVPRPDLLPALSRLGGRLSFRPTTPSGSGATAPTIAARPPTGPGPARQADHAPDSGRPHPRPPRRGHDPPPTPLPRQPSPASRPRPAPPTPGRPPPPATQGPRPATYTARPTAQPGGIAADASHSPSGNLARSSAAAIRTATSSAYIASDRSNALRPAPRRNVTTPSVRPRLRSTAHRACTASAGHWRATAHSPGRLGRRPRPRSRAGPDALHALQGRMPLAVAHGQARQVGRAGSGPARRTAWPPPGPAGRAPRPRVSASAPPTTRSITAWSAKPARAKSRWTVAASAGSSHSAAARDARCSWLHTEPQQGRLLLGLLGLRHVLEQPAHAQRNRFFRERRGQPQEAAAPAPPPLALRRRARSPTPRRARAAHPRASTCVQRALQLLHAL